MFHIDVSSFTAFFLSGSDDMKCQRGLTGSFRAVDLDDTSFGNTTDSQRHIQRERAGGECGDVGMNVFTQTHDGTLTVVFLYLSNGSFQSFFLIFRLSVDRDRLFRILSHSSPHI